MAIPWLHDPCTAGAKAEVGVKVGPEAWISRHLYQKEKEKQKENAIQMKISLLITKGKGAINGEFGINEKGMKEENASYSWNIFDEAV